MNKKTKKIAIILITSTISISLVLLLILNVRVEKIEDGNVYNEIIPEEEITDQELRKTTINLYYACNNEIREVVKRVDSNLLIENPYLVVMQELLKKENSGELESFIPEQVRINSVKRNGECLVIDLSKEFIEFMEDNNEVQSLAIKQIIKTMTQFTEVNAVKILVDGSDEYSFNNGNISFKQLFTDES